MMKFLQPKTEEQAAYWRVLAFAVAAFIFNTTEFIPVALLSDIGKSFAMPVSEVGLMMTVYAWVVTICSLPFMLLTAKLERRNLLMFLFIIFITGHVLSVIAWNFEMLLLSRLVIAVAHAVFWAITSSLVMRVAPMGKQHQALAWLSMGSALATVLGLPLGRIIGQLLGWRTTLGLIGVIALMVMILLWKLLPKLPSQNAGSLKSVPILFKRPLLIGIYALTAIGVTAHFTAYSYIEPFILQISQMNANWATIVLLIFGVSGMLASWLFGRFNQRMPNAFAITSLLLMLTALLLLKPLSGSMVGMFSLIFAWGVGMGGLALSMIVRVLHYAPDATDVATALYSGIFNIGIGGGALLGGIVMKQWGLANIGLVGAALAALGLTIFVWTNKRFAHTAPAPSNDTSPPMAH